jgi:hypothetical protein
LPDILFASRDPDCQCVTHGLCVTQTKSDCNP